MPAPTARYWALYGSTTHPTICGNCKTKKAALRHARRCEAEGGFRHWIIRVYSVKRTDRPGRRRTR